MTDLALDSSRDRILFSSRPDAALAARTAGVPVLDVVVPVHNEQATLADSVRRLHHHLREHFPFTARITIADNASIDDTERIARELASELSDVRVVRVQQKGRGRALHAVWSTSDAPVLAYMDARRGCFDSAGPRLVPYLVMTVNLVISANLMRKR